MKKFLSYALVAMMLVAMMLVAVVAMSVSAVTWSHGEGLWVHSGASYADSMPYELSPVIVTENSDGSISVEHGGYWKVPYVDGGVYTSEPVGLDGLSVEITFEKVPTPTFDCWFALHLLDSPSCFTTDGDTLGYKTLIRYGDPKLEYYGPSWGGLGSSEIGANNDMFALQSGDTLIMEVRYEFGQYIITYTHMTAGGVKTFEVPAYKTLDISNEVFNSTGRAHISILGSTIGLDSDWKYTVTVKEGVGLTDEQIAGQAFDQSKLMASETIDGIIESIDTHKADAVAALEDKYYANNGDVNDALEALDEAIEDAADAKKELEYAQDNDEVEAALAKVERAKVKASASQATIEELAELLNAGGECGDNAVWTYGDNTLVISGRGETDDWVSFLDTPWARYILEIEKVVVEDGITRIGNNAFREMSYLDEVKIADSVESIGECAFYYCTDLDEFHVPSDIEEIESYAFEGCYNLDYVWYYGYKDWEDIDIGNGNSYLDDAYYATVPDVDDEIAEYESSLEESKSPFLRIFGAGALVVIIIIVVCIVLALIPIAIIVIIIVLVVRSNKKKK